jgi:acetyl-CoA carboxylase biotin carboxyl carrier protein
MGLTNEDVERILRIVDESGYDEVRIEQGDLKVYLRRKGVQAAESFQPAARVRPEEVPASAPAAAAATERREKAAAEIPEGLVAVRAPMLGTFYRASSPGAAPFAEEGGMVSADATVCLIEVMKLFNTLKAGVAGRVVRFLVENGTMVEYDQPLLLIDPAAKP